MSLRMASYNIHRATGGDGREDATRIARVLREVDADLVALQEVEYRSPKARIVLEELAPAMYSHKFEGITLRDERGGYGNAVLSRLPAEEVRRLDISVAGREPRGAIELTLQTGGMDLQVIATHLGLRPRERRHQIEVLLERVTASSANVRILVGDLNEWLSWGRPLRRLRRVFDRIPAPATFPARRPRFALDRVWIRPVSALRQLAVHDSPTARTASDHLPLVADLVIPRLPADEPAKRSTLEGAGQRVARPVRERRSASSRMPRRRLL